jgi:DNA-binding transcriptional LysR family regulator
VRFGREGAANGYSELLLMERHTLVGSASFAGTPVGILLDRLPALHVLHEDVRLNLWPDWLAKAELPPRYAEKGIEFSNLQQAIHAARRGVGLAVVDLNMIADELAEGALVRISDVDISGPFGYWLDVPEAHRDIGIVSAFAEWLRHEAALPVRMHVST